MHILGEGHNRDDQNQTLLQAANIITWVLRFFPPFCLAKGLYNTLYIEVCSPRASSFALAVSCCLFHRIIDQLRYLYFLMAGFRGTCANSKLSSFLFSGLRHQSHHLLNQSFGKENLLQCGQNQ